MMLNDQEIKEPLVSVIIPFYNNVSWLCEAVESVLSQDYENYEILVINDGSNENVDEFLAKYSHKVSFFEKENGGPASARNYGIERSKGEYIAFLDSDDLWKPNKLSVQISSMLASKAPWSYTDYETFDETGKIICKKMLNLPEGLYNRIDSHIGTPTVIINKDILTKNNLKFDVSLRYGQDSFLWERLIDSFPILYVPVFLSRVRIRGSNAGRMATVQLNARVEVYDKCVECIPNYKNKKTLLFRFAMALCRFGCIFIKSEKKNNKLFEFFAKVLFAVPYVLFKIDRKINGNK